MHTRKFDYYSMDHTWGGGGQHAPSNVLRYTGNPTSTCIYACKIHSHVW